MANRAHDDDEDNDALVHHGSMDGVAAFRVQAKLRNNRLIKAREELGFTSAAAAAKALALDYGVLVTFEGLKAQPWSRKNGRWRPAAEKIAAAYGYACEELWPEVIARVTLTRSDYEVSEHMLALTAPADTESNKRDLTRTVNAVLASLPPKQEIILRDRFGLNPEGHERTLQEVGETLGVTSGRILTQEQAALRTLRGPGISRILSQYIEDKGPVEIFRKLTFSDEATTAQHIKGLEKTRKQSKRAAIKLREDAVCDAITFIEKIPLNFAYFSTTNNAYFHWLVSGFREQVIPAKFYVRAATLMNRWRLMPEMSPAQIDAHLILWSKRKGR